MDYKKPKNITPDEIRILMLKANPKIRQASIANELGVNRNAVYLVIEGKAVSDRIRRKIAEKVGVEVARIWPETYLSSGPRKPGRPKAA